MEDVLGTNNFPKIRYSGVSRFLGKTIRIRKEMFSDIHIQAVWVHPGLMVRWNVNQTLDHWFMDEGRFIDRHA